MLLLYISFPELKIAANSRKSIVGVSNCRVLSVFRTADQ
jgi:hypothetical protein